MEHIEGIEKRSKNSNKNIARDVNIKLGRESKKLKIPTLAYQRLRGPSQNI